MRHWRRTLVYRHISAVFFLSRTIQMRVPSNRSTRCELEAPWLQRLTYSRTVEAFAILHKQTPAHVCMFLIPSKVCEIFARDFRDVLLGVAGALLQTCCDGRRISSRKLSSWERCSSSLTFEGIR